MNRLDKAVRFIREEYGAERFRFDTLSQKLQMMDHIPKEQYEIPIWNNLTERDLNSLTCQCAAFCGDTNISTAEIRTVLMSDIVAAVNPLTDYLDHLPHWQPDNPDYIDELARQVTVKNENQNENENENQNQNLFRKCFRKWFVAMVAGWKYPDVVNHQVLVLIGRQGIYKTTWLEHLLPPELRAYGCKQPSTYDMSKDDRIRVAEFGLINLDEIDSCTQKELNQLKSVITTQDVNERAAYAHTKERRIRVASFCASGNNREFLIDDTGNRRWLPFEVESIVSPFEHQPVWRGIYAQAVYLLENGFNYWFDLDEIGTLETHNEDFRQKRNEEDLLGVYFTPCQPTDSQALFMTASEIHAKLKMWGNIERPMSLNKFGELLKRRQFEKKCLHNGKKGFVVQLHENLMNTHHEGILEIIGADSADSSF